MLIKNITRQFLDRFQKTSPVWNRFKKETSFGLFYWTSIKKINKKQEKKERKKKGRKKEIKKRERKAGAG